MVCKTGNEWTGTIKRVDEERREEEETQTGWRSVGGLYVCSCPCKSTSRVAGQKRNSGGEREPLVVASASTARKSPRWGLPGARTGPKSGSRDRGLEGLAPTSLQKDCKDRGEACWRLEDEHR